MLLKYIQKNKILKNIPNILSWIRIISSPTMLIPIMSGDKILFLIIFVGLGIIDSLDGIIARTFGLVSDYGRKIDSFGDYVWSFFGGVAFFVFFWNNLWDNYIQILVILISYLLPTIIILIRIKSIPQLHLVANKITGWIFGFTFIIFLLVGFNKNLLWLLTSSILFSSLDRVLFYLNIRNEKEYSLLSSISLIRKHHSESSPKKSIL